MLNRDTTILILTTEFPPQPGGIGNHAYNLAKSLQKSKNKVIVLTDVRSDNGKEEREFDKQFQFTIHRIKRRKPLLITFLARIKNAFKQVRNVEVVIASGKFSLWMVYILRLFYNKKYIAIIHGTEVLLSNSYLRKLTNTSLQKFNDVIAVSNYTKKLVADLQLKNTHVIPNGIDIENTKEILTKKLKGSPSLITVGNITDRKGQANVIKMLPTLIKHFPTIHYHCVGIPTQKEEFLQLAKQLKVENHLTFHGKVSNSKLYRLLKNSDIFVMLSKTTKTGDVEGFGIAILEANYFGKPAIGSDNCGIEDAILNGETGYLISNNDVNALTIAIKKIMGNYSYYSENSLKWAGKHHWKIIIKKYRKVINK